MGTTYNEAATLSGYFIANRDRPGKNEDANSDKSAASGLQVEAVLVNRENFIPFTPMMHEVAASDRNLTHIVNSLRSRRRKSTVEAGVTAGCDCRV